MKTNKKATETEPKPTASEVLQIIDEHIELDPGQELPKHIMYTKRIFNQSVDFLRIHSLWMHFSELDISIINVCTHQKGL